MKVFILSNLGENLYKNLLAESLAFQGVQVELEDDGRNLIFLPTVLTQPNVINLHKLQDFFLVKKGQHSSFFDRDIIRRPLKFLLFITQILILRIIGIKIVWTVHEWSDKFEGGRDSIPSYWCYIIGRLLDAVIVHCETTKKQINEALYLNKEGKTFVIQHGNYIGSYANEITHIQARNSLNIPAESLSFLLFGNIYRSKGFLEAIDDFKRLGNDRTFLIIAGYPVEDDIDEIIQEKIAGHRNILYIPKKIPDDDIQIYMNACDCVILPYKIFTTSGVTVLAMSFSKVCIAPNMGYFSDVLDSHGAFLYDFTEENSLLDAMNQAVEKQDCLTDMGKYNLQLAEARNWDYVAKETIKVYRYAQAQGR